ncbi:hypothetical protein BRC78_07425, partial [Halobacteriales archaeon QH_8_68_33]
MLQRRDDPVDVHRAEFDPRLVGDALVGFGRVDEFSALLAHRRGQTRRWVHLVGPHVALRDRHLDLPDLLTQRHQFGIHLLGEPRRRVAEDGRGLVVDSPQCGAGRYPVGAAALVEYPLVCLLGDVREVLPGTRMGLVDRLDRAVRRVPGRRVAPDDCDPHSLRLGRVVVGDPRESVVLPVVPDGDERVSYRDPPFVLGEDVEAVRDGDVRRFRRRFDARHRPPRPRAHEFPVAGSVGRVRPGRVGGAHPLGRRDRPDIGAVDALCRVVEQVHHDAVDRASAHFRRRPSRGPFRPTGERHERLDGGLPHLDGGGVLRSRRVRLAPEVRDAAPFGLGGRRGDLLLQEFVDRRRRPRGPSDRLGEYFLTDRLVVGPASIGVAPAEHRLLDPEDGAVGQQAHVAVRDDVRYRRAGVLGVPPRPRNRVEAGGHLLAEPRFRQPGVEAALELLDALVDRQHRGVDLDRDGEVPAPDDLAPVFRGLGDVVDRDPEFRPVTVPGADLDPLFCPFEFRGRRRPGERYVPPNAAMSSLDRPE